MRKAPLLALLLAPLLAWAQPSETTFNNFGSAPIYLITNPLNGQCLVYQSSTQKWINATCSTATGTVTSVGFSVPATSIFTATGSPVTSSGTLGLTTTGTSGGIPYFSSTSALSSSAALTANALLLGGGAGGTPTNLGSLGTATTLLHGNAGGAPSYTAITAADLSAVTGTTPYAFSLTGQTANTSIIGLDLENSTAATSGNQQRLCTAIGGQGFGTTAGTSQSVQLQICTIPVQGLVPSLQWILGVRIAGGTFVNLLEGTYAGVASFSANFDGTGNFNTSGPVLAQALRVNGSSSVAPTGSGLYALSASTVPTGVGFDINSVATGSYNATALTYLGDLVSDTLARGFQAKEGTNGKQGTCTLAAGTCTVTTTSVTANSRIFLTGQTLGTVAVPSGYSVSARTAGTSFTILASAPTDTSVIAYEMFEPAP